MLAAAGANIFTFFNSFIGFPFIFLQIWNDFFSFEWENLSDNFLLILLNYDQVDSQSLQFKIFACGAKQQKEDCKR